MSGRKLNLVLISNILGKEVNVCITLGYGKRRHLHPFPVLKDSKGRLYGWKVFRVADDGRYASGESPGLVWDLR